MTIPQPTSPDDPAGSRRPDDRDGPLGPLPIDSDTDVDTSRSGTPRPVHLRPAFLLLVAAGGAVGTAAREALSLAVPPVAGVPVVILAINVVGAFLLGVLLEALARRGDDAGRRRTLRLLLGTGVLGGFTTYSALATDSAALLAGGSPGAGVLYALGSVVVGGCASWTGIALAAAAHRRQDAGRAGRRS